MKMLSLYNDDLITSFVRYSTTCQVVTIAYKYIWMVWLSYENIVYPNDKF